MPSKRAGNIGSNFSRNMSATAQHQISYQANYIQQVLEDYASANGGECQVVSNMRDMWFQATQSSQKPMIYVAWIGETPWSSNANIAGLTGMVAREWRVGVKRGRGFHAVRGDSLTKTSTVIPCYDVIEDVRELIRSQIGLSEFAGFDNLKVSEWQLGNAVMDGKLISFFTKNLLPMISLTQTG